MPADIIELIWRDLRSEIQKTQTAMQRASLRAERAGYADSIPAFAFADLPLAADGGLGNLTSYVTVAWVSDGRRPGEGAGMGTGVLAFYQPSTDSWISVFDQTAVVI